MLKLWHKRLGHVSERGLNELAKRSAFDDSKSVKLELCDHCVLSKAKKHSYKKEVHNTQAPLDCIHIDIWGPSRTETHSGDKYFMTLIDDYSRKVWVIIVKQKFEAFERKNG